MPLPIFKAVVEAPPKLMVVAVAFNRLKVVADVTKSPPSTARSLGFKGNPENMFIPEIGIDLIGQYHKKNLDHFGNLTTHQLAIAYNTGSPWKRSSQSHLNRFNKWFKEKS